MLTDMQAFNKYKKLTNRQGKAECDLCRGSGYKIIYRKRGKNDEKYQISDNKYGKHPQLVRCTSCGLIYAYPREQELEILKKYSTFKDANYEQERIFRINNYGRIIKNILPILKTNTQG